MPTSSALWMHRKCHRTSSVTRKQLWRDSIAAVNLSLYKDSYTVITDWIVWGFLMEAKNAAPVHFIPLIERTTRPDATIRDRLSVLRAEQTRNLKQASLSHVQVLSAAKSIPGLWHNTRRVFCQGNVITECLTGAKHLLHAPCRESQRSSPFTVKRLMEGNGNRHLPHV